MKYVTSRKSKMLDVRNTLNINDKKDRRKKIKTLGEFGGKML
jgi:hypothetical protein